MSFSPSVTWTQLCLALSQHQFGCVERAISKGVKTSTEKPHTTENSISKGQLIRLDLAFMRQSKQLTRLPQMGAVRSSWPSEGCAGNNLQLCKVRRYFPVVSKLLGSTLQTFIFNSRHLPQLQINAMPVLSLVLNYFKAVALGALCKSALFFQGARVRWCSFWKSFCPTSSTYCL